MIHSRVSIISGRSRGTSIGFPTINVVSEEISRVYESGVYAARVKIGTSNYVAAVHIGPRPTFNDTSTIEIHLIDTTLGEAPEKIDELEIVTKLRDVQTFSSSDELRTQISKDIEAVRAILKLT